MRRLGFVVLGCVLALGCGGVTSDLTPVSGTVKLDGEPIGHAILTFMPEKGGAHGGTGMSGSDGRYVIVGPQGQKGLTGGSYKVVISRILRKDGTPPPADVPPIESDGVETLPVKYTQQDRTPLIVTVEPGKPIDFDLKSGKSK
jgi:hypothetical protein